MKNLSKKKLLLLAFVLVFAVSTAGCRVPTDEAGAIKQISTATSFSEVMSSENWFSAILVWPMAQALNALQPTLGVVGAIALLTILVNGVILLLTLKSTIATQQMQLLQPEMEKIQRKYEGKDDDASRMKMAQEQQALWKKYNVNPFSMILTMFLQFPIIIAMYQAVQRSSAIKSGTFLGLSLETTPMAGLRSGQWLYLVIFAVMGVCQYVSMMTPQWLAKKKAKEEAEKRHKKPAEANGNQQKLMQYYMLAMILVFGLVWPAAMSIYWAINSLVTIAKTLIVQRIIDKKKKEGLR